MKVEFTEADRQAEYIVTRLERFCQRLEVEGQHTNADIANSAAEAIKELIEMLWSADNQLLICQSYLPTKFEIGQSDITKGTADVRDYILETLRKWDKS